MFYLVLLLAVIPGAHNTETISHTSRFTYTNILKKILNDEVVNCAVFDFMCPDNFSCILWEDRCGDRPCRLLPICLVDVDVFSWLEICAAVGCARDACFMRQPQECEDNEDCDVFPDCAVIGAMKTLPEQCQRFICPRGYACQEMNATCEEEECTTTLACIADYARMHMENHADETRKNFMHVRKPSHMEHVNEFEIGEH